MTAISYLEKLTLRVFYFLYITVFIYVKMLGRGGHFGLFNFVFALFSFQAFRIYFRLFIMLLLCKQ